MLLVRLYDALENGRQEEANIIQAVMRGENQKRNPRSIDRKMVKARTPAPIMVETVIRQRQNSDTILHKGRHGTRNTQRTWSAGEEAGQY